MKIKDIATCAQLACILEASSPKPGNVSRYHDFGDTKYEHFMASGVAIGKYAETAALRGSKVLSESLSFRDIGTGRLIHDLILETQKWHSGRNTNLGTAMLLVPLSAACGACRKLENEAIRENFDRILKGSTYKDTIHLYEAVKLAAPGGLGRVNYLDVRNGRSAEEIRKKKLGIYDVMELVKEDSIAKELTTRMRVSFETGYPAMREEYSKSKNLRNAIVYCFMRILSEVPDSLIARKNGKTAAVRVSEEAKRILNSGMTDEKMRNFDAELRDKKNMFNPGTTADLVASSTMIALLNGLRP